MLGPINILGLKNNLGSKKIWQPKKILVQQTFGTNRIVSPKKFWAPKNFESEKKFWSVKNFGDKKFEA